MKGKITAVSGARDDTLLLRDKPQSEEFSIAKNFLTRVDLSTRRGSPGLGTLGGALVGAVVGAGAGLGVGNLLTATGYERGNEFVAFNTTVLGLVVGGISGGIIGHRLARERWQRLTDPHQIRIALAAPHRGLGVAVRWPTR